MDSSYLSLPCSHWYLNDTYLEPYLSRLSHADRILHKRIEVSSMLDRSATKRFWEHLIKIPSFSTTYRVFYDDVVSIGDRHELSSSQHECLRQQLQSLKPWRKGPFEYFGIPIDSEWISSLKWDRVVPHVDLHQKIIGDIGCNNGYYMLRMLASNPRLVIGFEPLERYFFFYRLNQHFLQERRLGFELFGVEDLNLFEQFFDVLFVMGILYHRRNPLQMLQDIHRSLKPEGILVLESAGIPGDDSICLFPEDRYLKATGYWFLPTVTALVNMLKRSQFYDIQVLHSSKLEPNEQRDTPWVGTESLTDFLDPTNSDKTVEGYPAPIRIYIQARKKRRN